MFPKVPLCSSAHILSNLIMQPILLKETLTAEEWYDTVSSHGYCILAITYWPKLIFGFTCIGCRIHGALYHAILLSWEEKIIKLMRYGCSIPVTSFISMTTGLVWHDIQLRKQLSDGSGRATRSIMHLHLDIILGVILFSWKDMPYLEILVGWRFFLKREPNAGHFPLSFGYHTLQHVFESVLLHTALIDRYYNLCWKWNARSESWCWF